MFEIIAFLKLLLGTVIYRPYVYAFFACFLLFAVYHLGWKRMWTFLVSTFIVAFLCEYSSTRNGFPFGPYTYLDSTRDRELWISNVPFWDSLSFVFLSYFSFTLAASIIGSYISRWTPVVGGVLMMLLDVVIDPLTLQGHRWFLGQVYFYPYEGFYFGVTFANFVGWFFVGWLSQRLYQVYMQVLPWFKSPMKKTHPLFTWGVFGVYAGVLVFNLLITYWIKEFPLAYASTVVTVVTLCVVGFFLKRQVHEAR